MSPRHHLDPSTVVSRAAGALSPELSAVVDAHLEACAACRDSLARAEDVGGLLLAQQQPAAAAMPGVQRLRRDMLERLERLGPPAPAAPAPTATRTDPDRIPASLQPYFGPSLRALRWRWMGPGMHFVRRAGPSGATLLMLRIGPGKRLPLHGHGGSEITQILAGAYEDALGRFAAGDVADLDNGVEHQPVTTPGAPCICVSALDAPLRFPGWFARRLQPVLGI